MISVDITNRPFAAEPFSGLMLPDGIFESSLGTQTLNAGLKNQGASDLGAFDVYVESVSNPGVDVQAETISLPGLPGGASRTLSWNVNVAGAPPGVHYISFIARRGTDTQRIIKKIFVTRVDFDPATATFTATTPEGVFRVQFHDLMKPREPCCLPRLKYEPPHDDRNLNFLQVAAQHVGHDPRFVFCPPGYLPHSFDASVTPTPAYQGQYGDLPYEDPWWKVVLCLIAVLLLIGAAIAAAVTGGSVTVTGGSPGSSGSPVGDCCGVRADGGSSSYVVAGLVAAAAACATAAALSDVRDPFRRGEDNTPPPARETTTGEALKARIDYLEPVQPGRPFAVGTEWTYTRTTDAASYDHHVQETNQNIHVVSRYEIQAPNVVRLYQREKYKITAEFYGPGEAKFHGDQLFVQCILAGPSGQYRRFLLQDDGVTPDEKPNDGVYTGIYDFSHEKPDPRGLWQVFVIAQDVNHAQPDMPPEEAAQIIGGMLLTHQVTIDFQGGTCPMVPDGDLHVI